MASRFLNEFPVPNGFIEILDKLTKAILRDQPENIVLYATEYFENIGRGVPTDANKDRSNPKIHAFTQIKPLKIKKLIHQFYDQEFKSDSRTHKKEEIIPFIRSFTAKYSIQQEPYPNTIQQMSHRLSYKQNYSKQQFLEFVVRCFDF